jgi:hypothetical protein
MDALKGRIGGSGSGDVRTAIAGRCDVIITTNLAHFTEEAVGPYGTEVRDPDDFRLGQVDLAPGVFCQAISKIRPPLKSPPYTVEEYLATFSRCGLVGTAAELQQFRTLLEERAPGPTANRSPSGARRGAERVSFTVNELVRGMHRTSDAVGADVEWKLPHHLSCCVASSGCCRPSPASS